jgi:predicted enzyme related to lactoylglutathione lyase
MKTQLNHTALNVNDFDWYLNFFQEVFDMEIQKERGGIPNRQLWFTGVKVELKPMD